MKLFLTLLCLLQGASCGRAQLQQARGREQRSSGVGGAAAVREAARRGEVRVFRLPEEWAERREGVEQLQHAYIEHLELRRSPDGPDGEYLLAGFAHDSDYSHEFYKDIPPTHYTANVFAVAFNSDFRVRRADRGEWERAGRRVSTKPHWKMIEQRPEVEKTEFTYRGLRYAKRGEHWGSPVLLSPSGKWLALFSYSGRKTKPDLIFGGGEPRRGDVFWDVYDTLTGERVASWEARGVSSPASFRRAEAWLGERHLLVPADARAESYVVFTLPEFTPVENPGTLRFPEWVGEDGAPMRLPDARADKTVQGAERALEARVLADASRPAERELLFRLRDKWVVRVPPQPPRGAEGWSPGGLRGRTNQSRTVYAVALDGSYRVRAASVDEWERAKKVDANHNAIDLEETYESFGGTRRVYRPFQKTGEVWGEPRALGGEWLAVFSHTPAAEAGTGGVLHVEIYDARPGTLLVSTRAPHAGPADAIFSRALWVDRHFLALPLDDSYNSLLLWLLPETGGML